MKKIFLIISVLFFTQLLYAVKIDGYVYNAMNKQVVPGVEVSIKGTNLFTFTDANGYFSIEAPNNYLTESNPLILLMFHKDFANKEYVISEVPKEKIEVFVLPGKGVKNKQQITQSTTNEDKKFQVYFYLNPINIDIPVGTTDENSTRYEFDLGLGFRIHRYLDFQLQPKFQLGSSITQEYNQYLIGDSIHVRSVYLLLGVGPMVLFHVPFNQRGTSSLFVGMGYTLAVATNLDESTGIINSVLGVSFNNRGFNPRVFLGGDFDPSGKAETLLKVGVGLNFL